MQQALYEKYRPKSWAELIGNDKAKAVIAFKRDHGGICNEAFWIKGKSGSGKTCIARLIAKEGNIIGELSIEDLNESTLYLVDEGDVL